MIALLPLLISIIPEIAHWIAGDTAGVVAQKVADVAQTVLGTTDPAAAATLLTDQGKVTDLRIALARIGADVEQARLNAQTATLAAMLADTQGARAQTVQLAASGSSIAWGAPVVSVLVLATFGYGMWVVFHMPAGDASITQIGMVEALKVLATGVVGYWVGSSHSSQAKDAVIATAVQGVGVTRPLS